jgi:hypothetical protein
MFRKKPEIGREASRPYNRNNPVNRNRLTLCREPSIIAKGKLQYSRKVVIPAQAGMQNLPSF